VFYGNYRTKFPKLNGQFILNFCDRYLAVEEALSAFCSYEAVAVRILERPLIDDGLPDKPTALDPLMTNVLVGNPVRGL
jgi:hypothetical protein